MDQEKDVEMKRVTKQGNVIYLVLVLAIFGLVILGIVNRKDDRSRNEYQNRSGRADRETVNTVSERTDRYSDFFVPTEDPLVRARNIMICKYEFEGLRSKARQLGTKDMLTMSGDSAEANACEFTVRSLSSIGSIRTSVPSGQGNFTVTLRFPAARENSARLWTKASLLYLSNQIGEEMAEEAVETAFNEETADYELFRINIKSSVDIDGTAVTPVKIIEISGTLDMF